MKTLRFLLTVGVVLMCLVTAACGNGQVAPATQAPVSVAPSQALTPAAAASTAPAATQPGQATAKPGATATIDTTRKIVDLSRSNQPGSTIAGTAVEPIIFGEGYDDKQNQIVAPAFAFPVTIPKVLFAFGVANGTQSLAFTETLKLNGAVIPLPVTKFAVPPSGAGQKQLRVKGLAVKAGAQFPVGQYQIEVYSAGQLLQHGIFDVRESKSTGLRFDGGASAHLVAWSGEGQAQVDPDIFVVTEEEITVVPDDVNYYKAPELQAAYQQLGHMDELYKPFPEEVQAAVQADAARETAALCANAGGVFESASGQCMVNNDPAQACQAIGGTYDPATNDCSFGGSGATNTDTPEPTLVAPTGADTPEPTLEAPTDTDTPVPIATDAETPLPPTEAPPP